MSKGDLDLLDELNRLLSQPIRRAVDAERAARAADALAELLRARENAEKTLTETTNATRGLEHSSLVGSALQDAAEIVLEESGRPLHAKELGRRIKARGWAHRSTPSRPDQIVHQLAARLPRYPRRFQRVAPNTFALTKWYEGGEAPRQRPRVALFKGPGGDVARQIGELPDAPAGDDTWRSS